VSSGGQPAPSSRAGELTLLFALLDRASFPLREVFVFTDHRCFVFVALVYRSPREIFAGLQKEFPL